MKKTYVFIIAAACGFAASAVQFKTERNISYYPESGLENAPAYQRSRCVLDIKYPLGVTGFPTVVNFHGGGLVAGGKHFAPWPKGEAEAVAFVGVNYRLITNATPAQCLSDSGAAVAWTLNNIARYGGDPKKVFVTGISGGGYITAMVGMDKRWLAPWGYKPSDLAGIAPLTGQMTKHFNVRKVAFKDDDPQFSPKIDEWAPLFYAGAKGLPPAAFLAGGRDLEWKCRVEENELLAASMRNCGYPATEFHETEGSHGGGVEPSSYFLRDFVMRYSRAGIWRPAAGECAAVHGEGDAAQVASALYLFHCLRHPGSRVYIRAGKPVKKEMDILLDDPAGNSAYARAGRVLERMRECPLVAQAVVDAVTGRVWQRRDRRNKPETKNAVVSAVLKCKDRVSFTYAPKAMPLPAAVAEAAKECAFLDKLNRELIVVENLAAGEYDLLFDGRKIGRFTAEEFAKGVNVAALDTPNRRIADEAAGLAKLIPGAEAREAEELQERLAALRPVVSRVSVISSASVK